MEGFNFMDIMSAGGNSSSETEEAKRLAQEAADTAKRETDQAAQININSKVRYSGGMNDYKLEEGTFGGVSMPGLEGSLTNTYAQRKAQAQLIKQQDLSGFGGFQMGV